LFLPFDERLSPLGALLPPADLSRLLGELRVARGGQHAEVQRLLALIAHAPATPPVI
jgi:hypothetical protein